MELTIVCGPRVPAMDDRRTPPSGCGLGTYGRFVRHAPIDPDTGEILAPLPNLSPLRRSARKYGRARAMAALLQSRDLAGCHAWMQSKAAPVAVHTKPGAVRSGFFTGLQSCGLVHLCAHCQPKIAARRAGEVQAAVDAWTAEGGSVLLVTLTLSHGRADPLATTLGALKGAGQRMARHRAFAALRALWGCWDASSLPSTPTARTAGIPTSISSGSCAQALIVRR